MPWRSPGVLWSSHWPCGQSDPWSFHAIETSLSLRVFAWITGLHERPHLRDKVESNYGRHHADLWLLPICTYTCAHTQYSKQFVVAHVYNIGIWETKTRETVWIQGQPGYQNDFKANMNCNEILSPKAESKTENELINVFSYFLRLMLDIFWLSRNSNAWYYHVLLKGISACKLIIKFIFVLWPRSILLCWFPMFDLRSMLWI